MDSLFPRTKENKNKYTFYFDESPPNSKLKSKQKLNQWFSKLTSNKYDFICEKESVGSKLSDVNKKNDKQNNLTKIVRVSDVVFPTDIKDTIGRNKITKASFNNEITKQQACKQTQDQWLPGLIVKNDFICEDLLVVNYLM